MYRVLWVLEAGTLGRGPWWKDHAGRMKGEAGSCGVGAADLADRWTEALFLPLLLLLLCSRVSDDLAARLR